MGVGAAMMNFMIEFMMILKRGFKNLMMRVNFLGAMAKFRLVRYLYIYNNKKKLFFHTLGFSSKQRKVAKDAN